MKSKLRQENENMTYEQYKEAFESRLKLNHFDMYEKLKNSVHLETIMKLNFDSSIYGIKSGRSSCESSKLSQIPAKSKSIIEEQMKHTTAMYGGYVEPTEEEKIKQIRNIAANRNAARLPHETKWWVVKNGELVQVDYKEMQGAINVNNLMFGG